MFSCEVDCSTIIMFAELAGAVVLELLILFYLDRAIKSDDNR
jgi:hypothetical protein